MGTEQVETSRPEDVKNPDSKIVLRREKKFEDNHKLNLKAWRLARKILKYGRNHGRKTIVRDYLGYLENNMVDNYVDPTDIKKKLIEKEMPVAYAKISSTMDYLKSRGVFKEYCGFYKITEYGSKFISSVKTMKKLRELDQEHGISISRNEKNPDSGNLNDYKITIPNKPRKHI